MTHVRYLVWIARGTCLLSHQAAADEVASTQSPLAPSAFAADSSDGAATADALNVQQLNQVAPEIKIIITGWFSDCQSVIHGRAVATVSNDWPRLLTHPNDVPLFARARSSKSRGRANFN